MIRLMEYQTKQDDIIFDVFDYNYSWGFYYKGHLIKENGDLFSYKLIHEDIRVDNDGDPFTLLKTKKAKSIFIKTISEQLMNQLKELFNSLKLKSCIEKSEVNGYDMPHIEYYGYNNDKHISIRLYSSGERTCNYENNEIAEKNARKLVKLLSIIISDKEKNQCHYCHKEGADYIDIDNMNIYCNDECRDNDELYGQQDQARMVDHQDVPVMMMIDQSGRRRRKKKEDR